MTEDIITITAPAQEKISELLDAREEKNSALRVSIDDKMPGSVQAGFRFVSKDDQTDDDHVIPCNGFDVYIDIEVASLLQGAVVDYDDTRPPGGFSIQVPPQAVVPPGVERKEWDDPLAIAVQEVIDTRVNPGIASHGGYVSLVDVKGDAAYVELMGGCKGCAMSRMTLQNGIEVMIKEAIPQITQVIDATDHALGENPYYQQTQEGETPLAGN